MSEKRVNTIVLLFLFIAVGFGVLAAMVDFGHATNYLTRSGNPGKVAVLALTDGIVNFGFALFLLAFSAAYKTKETPESIIEILSFALFMRLLFVGYFIFNLIPLEPGIKGKLQLQYFPLAGALCTMGQAFFLALGVGLMGRDDMIKTDDMHGRDGVISVDAYLTGKSPSQLKAEQESTETAAAKNTESTGSEENKESTATTAAETAESKESDDSTEEKESDENSETKDDKKSNES